MKKSLLSIAIAMAFSSTLQAQNFEPAASKQLSQGGVVAAQARSITGQGVTIGILDQGFDLTHRDFAGSIVASRNFYTSGPVTWGSHGTAMAGVAAANRDGTGTLGVAPDAKLLLAQAGPGGTNTVLNQYAVYSALSWLSSSGAAVINLSFGSAYSSAFTTTIQRSTRTGIYFASAGFGPNYGANSSVINNYKIATDRGSILVAAAGNQGLGYSEFPGMYATRTDASGKLILNGRMIIVGAVDSNNVIANFSDRAGHICQNSAGLTCRDPYLTRDFYVVAPGVNIISTQANQQSGGKNSAISMSGTSPAAAYVTGGIALLKQAWPQLRAEQLVSLVLTTAKDLGAPGVDNVYGRGLVDFDRASQPQGSLKVAMIAQPLGTGIQGGVNLVGTGISGGVGASLKTSSVLGNTQVIDEIGRNYSADLTKSIMSRSFAYDALSPYMGYTGYRPVSFGMDQMLVTVLAGNTGTALNLQRDFGKFQLSYQLGAHQEQNGFVGNYGVGALSLGNSATSWHIIGIDVDLSNQWRATANYGQGRTQVNNQSSTMIQVTGPVYTDTTKLGLTRSNLFKQNDQLAFGIAHDVRIKSGHAVITAVTGYDFVEDQQGEITGVPIVSKETVNLRQSAVKLLWTDYRVNIDNHRRLSAGLAGNQFGYRLGVNFSWTQ